MRIPDSNWLGRLERATHTEGTSEADATRRADLVKAGDDIFVKAAAYAQQAGGTPLDVGARLWGARGRDGIPGLADRIASGQVDDVKTHLKGATLDEVGQLVDALAVRMLASEGREDELHKLLDLKVVADAGKDLIPQYNRRVRSQLAHQRPEAKIDPKFAEAFGAIEQRVADHYVAKLVETGTDKVRAGAVQGSKVLWAAGLGLADKIRGAAGGDNRVSAAIRGMTTKAKDAVKSALPEEVVARLQQAKDGASVLLDALDGVEKVDSDRELAARFTATLPALKETLDPKANAVAVGMLKEGAAVVTGSAGHEMVYLRDTGELQINELSGLGLRLGIGGTVRAFTRNAYGDVASDPEHQRRSGAEIGAICGHLGTYKNAGGGSRGWHSTFSLGYNLSVPLLSDQSVFDVKADRVRTVKLDPQEIQRIEAQLGHVSSGAAKWHGKMRSATAG